VSLMGWVQGILRRDREHRARIADRRKLRTQHARALAEAERQRRTGNSR
jgi:hypothetical protein